jgi:hypothetical protein
MTGGVSTRLDDARHPKATQTNDDARERNHPIYLKHKPCVMFHFFPTFGVVYLVEEKALVFFTALTVPQ